MSNIMLNSNLDHTFDLKYKVTFLSQKWYSGPEDLCLKNKKKEGGYEFRKNQTERS